MEVVGECVGEMRNVPGGIRTRRAGQAQRERTGRQQQWRRRWLRHQDGGDIWHCEKQKSRLKES